MKKMLPVACLLLILAPALRAADAQENWDKNCAACHGKDGKGATKAGRMAGVKDMTDATYQKTFTDEQAATSVKNGIKNDKGSDKMKPFGDKLTDDEIKALIAQVRTMGK